MAETSSCPTSQTAPNTNEYFVMLENTLKEKIKERCTFITQRKSSINELQSQQAIISDLCSNFLLALSNPIIIRNAELASQEFPKCGIPEVFKGMKTMQDEVDRLMKQIPDYEDEIRFWGGEIEMFEMELEHLRKRHGKEKEDEASLQAHKNP